MSLEEVFKRIGALREDLEQLGYDITVAIDAHPRDHPESPYAELAAKLREAFEEAPE